ncbi:MAG: YlmC/YmxH family sporulation protein [Clostridiales bacterium]|jgi:YlmC/YmxH family sporulation protein|nr:YlmC/YmxH family sporulation protein [Clostridiales bacterium]
MDIQLSFQELKCKDVVNVVDGKKLGRIIDVVFDIKGRVEGMVTPGFRKMLFMKASDDIFIPWCDIKKIGDDVILVELKTHRLVNEEKHERKEQYYDWTPP